MLLELAEDWELRMRRMLPMLEVSGGAGMRGCGVAAAPVAGIAIVDRAPPPRAATAATAPTQLAAGQASQPRGSDTVDAAAASRALPAPLGGYVGERRRRAAALAAAVTVIVRRRRLQAV